MGTTALITLILGILGLASSVGLGAYQATQNKQATEQANETNLQISRETNQANVEQANLAYQRSLPTSQVRNLMAAGMSRAGALQSLTGGGSYTAPTLQGTRVEPETMDLSGVTESLQRLYDIPSNVEQAGIVSEQRKALQQDTAQKAAMFEKDMQIKTQDLLSKKLANIGNMYGQREKRETDELASAIVDAMYKSGRAIDSFDSEQSVYDLMKDNDLFKNVTNTARQNAIDIARQRMQDKNINRAALDTHQAAEDAHDIAIKHKTQLQQQIDDFNAAKDARQKEYKARELKAELLSIASEMGIADQEFERGLRYVRDNYGRLARNPAGAAYEGVTDIIGKFWQGIFKVIPIDALGKSLLNGMINVNTGN